MIGPSPEEIEARIVELDALTKDEEDYTFEEWEREAMERLILHLWTVHYAMCSNLWGQAMTGLVDASEMCKKVAMNVVAQLPHDEVVLLLKNRLEVIAQHPVAVDTDDGTIVAFRLDHPTVPDTYEP